MVLGKESPRTRFMSDILFRSCLRIAFYARTVKDYELTVEDIDNFVRGESSEHVLVGLADIGMSTGNVI